MCFFDINCKIREFIKGEASKLIDQAKQAFEQAMDHVFDEDISPLLDKVEAAIDAGIDKVNNDVNETINHIESAIINQIVQKGLCMEAGGAKQIYKLLKALNPYYRVSHCWHSLGYKITMSLEDKIYVTDIQLYNYQKECILLNKITPTTPIEGPGGILETYAQGQLYAAEYCIGETANARTFQDVLIKEWLLWGCSTTFGGTSYSSLISYLVHK